MANDATSNPTAARSKEQLPQLSKPPSLTYETTPSSVPAEPATFEFASPAGRPRQPPPSELEGKRVEGVVIHDEPISTISSATSNDLTSFSWPDIKSTPTPPSSPNFSTVKLRGGALSTSDTAAASNSPAPRGRKRIAPTPVDSMVKRQKTTQGGRGRKTKDDAFNDPDAILGPDKSPIYDEALSLQAILEHPNAQAILNSTENFLSDISNEDLQRTIADFKEDGRSGRHDAQWLTEANEASGRRMAGDFDPYLAAVFTDTWGEEDEVLSDSDGEQNEEDKERMAIDQDRSKTKDGGKDASEVGNASSDSHTNGHDTSTSDHPTGAVEEQSSGMDDLDTANEADYLDEMPDTDSSNGSEPGVDASALDEISGETPGSNPTLADPDQSNDEAASLANQDLSVSAEPHPPDFVTPNSDGDDEMMANAEPSNNATQVTAAPEVDDAKDSTTLHHVQ